MQKKWQPLINEFNVSIVTGNIDPDGDRKKRRKGTEQTQSETREMKEK